MTRVSHIELNSESSCSCAPYLVHLSAKNGLANTSPVATMLFTYPRKSAHAAMNGQSAGGAGVPAAAHTRAEGQHAAAAGTAEVAPVVAPAAGCRNAPDADDITPVARALRQYVDGQDASPRAHAERRWHLLFATPGRRHTPGRAPGRAGNPGIVRTICRPACPAAGRNPSAAADHTPQAEPAAADRRLAIHSRAAHRSIAKPPPLRSVHVFVFSLIGAKSQHRGCLQIAWI
jgi:hypothetical protein